MNLPNNDLLRTFILKSKPITRNVITRTSLHHNKNDSEVVLVTCSRFLCGEVAQSVYASFQKYTTQAFQKYPETAILHFNFNTRKRRIASQAGADAEEAVSGHDLGYAI